MLLTAFVASSSGIPEIDAGELKQLLESERVTVLDARLGRYDDRWRIPGAAVLSFRCSAKEAAQVIPNKESCVVTYCTNKKCPASRWLARHLQRLGYTDVREFSKGMIGWREAGYPVTKASERSQRPKSRR